MRTSSPEQQPPRNCSTSDEETSPISADVPKQSLRKGQESVGRTFSPAFTKRKSSVDWSNKAKAYGSLVYENLQPQNNGPSLAVRSPATPLRPQLSKKEAAAIRHAKVLEQMLSAPSQKSACLIVNQNKAVAGDVVTRKQAVSLKKALLDTKAAPRVINQVKALDGVESAGFLPAESAVERALTSVQNVDALPELIEGSKGTSDLLVRARRVLVKRLSINAVKEKEAVALSSVTSLASPFPHSKSPLKAVCLDRTDAEAALLALMPGLTPSEGNSTKAPSDVTRNGNAFSTSRASVISLASTSVLGRLGEASGALLRQTAINDGIHPPLDRMAIFVFWWGFEVTLPSPTMQYLQTAHNISGTVLNVLSIMVTVGGLFEMLPYIRYISMTIDVEFKAIQAVDQGNGAVLAATVSSLRSTRIRTVELTLTNSPF
jgi:hypothetical protein